MLPLDDQRIDHAVIQVILMQQTFQQQMIIARRFHHHMDGARSALSQDKGLNGLFRIPYFAIRYVGRVVNASFDKVEMIFGDINTNYVIIIEGWV